MQEVEEEIGGEKEKQRLPARGREVTLECRGSEGPDDITRAPVQHREAACGLVGELLATGWYSEAVLVTSGPALQRRAGENGTQVIKLKELYKGGILNCLFTKVKSMKMAKQTLG